MEMLQPNQQPCLRVVRTQPTQNNKAKHFHLDAKLDLLL